MHHPWPTGLIRMDIFCGGCAYDFCYNKMYPKKLQTRMYIVELSWGCGFFSCFFTRQNCILQILQSLFLHVFFPKPTTPCFSVDLFNQTLNRNAFSRRNPVDVPHGSSSRIVAVDPLGTKGDKAPKDHYLHQRFGPRWPHTSPGSRDPPPIIRFPYHSQYFKGVFDGGMVWE